MVLRQVGKGCHFIVKAPHSVQGDGMGGHLHNGISTACLHHGGQQSLKLKALRGGALRGDALISNPVVHGADESHLGTLYLLDDVFQKQGGGGLAVGAGDADKFQLLPRLRVVVCPNLGQGQPVGHHLHPGNPLWKRLGGHHAGRPLFHGHGDKPVAVGGKAGDRHEKAALFHLPGVVGHIGNLHIHIRRGLHHLHVFQKFSELHR